LNHGQSELDGDDFAEVGDRSDEWVVAVPVEQHLQQSHFVLASEACEPDRSQLVKYGSTTDCAV